MWPNPINRHMPGQAIIETVGRHSGLPRRTPIGGRPDGRTFWLVSDHGMESNHVRNVAANPRVRVKVRGRWYTGTAHLLPEDDARLRLRRLPPGRSRYGLYVGSTNSTRPAASTTARPPPSAYAPATPRTHLAEGPPLNCQNSSPRG